MDAALCGGGDPNQGVTNTAVRLSSSAVNMVKAAIFMGDPMFKAGLSYDVGTCAAGGVCFSRFPCSGQSMILTILVQFDARPAGFYCPSASKIQSYCDASDPYCCNGNNAATHQGYGSEYGSKALAFVKSKLG
jgi:acetylxylan esterase